MTTAHRHSRGLALVATIVGVLATTPAPVRAVDFPAADALYHTYPEMVADIQGVEAAHLDLVHVFSIGKSARNREIWAAKVSDHVELDEDESEVLVDALHHGDEHLTLEQALFLLHTLVDGYGPDEQVTALVDSREIWIVFAVNPDGAEFDLSGHPYLGWRKNRQPNPSSSSVGTDLNRNYAYAWGCCGGSSASPSSRTYRGWAPFSAPETRALSDFVNSRVIGGRQQIRTHITLHTNGELILWPFAHTRADLTPDMTAADRNAFIGMAGSMAATNGYRAMQSGDWYISDGDEIDWMYGRHRIFSFTVELYPPEGSTGLGGHYPPDEVIASETARNRAALLYLIDLADCPYRAAGTEAANCGLLYDDLELARGWTRNLLGEDTATGGAWARGDPAPVVSNGPKQLGMTASGSRAFVTGLAGSPVTSYDLDGQTSVASRTIALPKDAASFGPLTFRWYFAHSATASAADAFRVYVFDTETEAKTLVFERLGKHADVDASWKSASVSLADFADRTIRLLFVAADNGANNLVEAAFDDVRIQRPG